MSPDANMECADIFPSPVGDLGCSFFNCCACGVAGVSYESWQLARPEQQSPWLCGRRAMMASMDLTSVMLPDGTLPAVLLTEVMQALVLQTPDDDIVRTGGSGSWETHLVETDYRSTRRTRMAACENGLLKSYVSGTVKPGSESMRHVTPLYFRLTLAVWRACWPWLPPECQVSPMDLIAIQPFCLARRDFMAYHTDSKPDRRRKASLWK